MKEHFMTHGVFSWNELLTTNLDSAKEFYGKLFGWEFTETETIHGTPYLVAMKGETMVAGMMGKEGLPENVPSLWDPYVTVDDVDTATKEVEELGGTVILPPTEIPNVGRFSVVQDPQGIGLNLITYDKKLAE